MLLKQRIAETENVFYNTEKDFWQLTPAARNNKKRRVRQLVAQSVEGLEEFEPIKVSNNFTSSWKIELRHWPTAKSRKKIIHLCGDQSIYLAMFIWKQILKGNPCLLLQIKFTVQGREVVIPLGHDAGDERENSTCRTTQHVLVAKDEGLISDEAYHELRMALPDEEREILPPISVLKQERNRQNGIIALHSIPEVSENKCNLF